MSITIKCRTSSKSHCNKPRRIWIYQDADFTKACELIQLTDWDSLLSDDVNLSTELWSKKFLDIMKECIPQQDLKKRRNLPWLTKNIVRHMRKRNAMFQRAKRTKDPSLLGRYKKMRNKVLNMLRSAKQNYFNSLSTAKNKQFWKIVKLVSGQQSLVPTLSQDNTQATTDRDKANMLNEFFSKCWNYSEPPLCDPPRSESVQHGNCPDDLLCTTDKIVQLIEGLNTTKANGPDGISVKMLKATADSIGPSLTNLFNLSISRGQFPEPWKRTRVVPIPKSSSVKYSPSGYRPISLLSILSKLLEKHLRSLLACHLAEHHPISDVQWGFQEGKSTLTALLSVTNNWLSLLDHSQEVCCIFFDFQKAFDTVPHQKLLKKVEQLDIHPLILHWLHSYLTNRKQSVVVGGAESRSISVVSGVPQGSVLGPLLFLIYMNSISDLNLSDGSKLTLYADDMLFIKPSPQMQTIHCSNRMLT